MPDKREDSPAGFHRSDRDQAKRMIDKMQEDEGAQHGPGDQVRFLAGIGGNNRQTVCPGLPAAAGRSWFVPLIDQIAGTDNLRFLHKLFQFCDPLPNLLKSEEYPGVRTR